LCNGLLRGSVLLQLFHREVETPPMDVQVSAGRREVGVPEQLADVVGRYPGLIEP
jgi:hypothetical protein